ncbi:TetR/AcrR family transcriptional regulator [Enterococcus sp. LJL51]|uniref:TetR/AcrR family transcriptional regulator n=1 Tax=Enterococcus sp. LJL51 TaxID=3416656 RepID=UPI003CECCE4C
MVRKKVYTKDQILKSSYNIVLKEGFSGITARNVADKMGISTQPIYLEFSNMDDLKVNLLKMMHSRLEKNYYVNCAVDDPIIDFGLNVINLAKNDSKLFMHLYIDHHGYGELLNQLTLSVFEKQLSQAQKYLGLEKETIIEIYEKIWITAAGLATLLASDAISLSDKAVNSLLKEAVEKYL